VSLGDDQLTQFFNELVLCSFLIIIKYTIKGRNYREGYMVIE